VHPLDLNYYSGPCRLVGALLVLKGSADTREWVTAKVALKSTDRASDELLVRVDPGLTFTHKEQHMLEKLRKERGDEGFTLIELLVVIIIIGILAAIAIPVFLNQRTKGWEAAVQSDLRNAATAQETWLTQNDVYTSNMADLTGDGTAANPGVGFKYSADKNYKDAATVKIDIVTANAGNDYCMEAQAAGDPGVVFSYSSPGGLQRGVPCP
jgi:type IV pilus assembly protein PilA